MADDADVTPDSSSDMSDAVLDTALDTDASPSTDIDSTSAPDSADPGTPDAADAHASPLDAAMARLAAPDGDTTDTETPEPEPVEKESAKAEKPADAKKTDTPEEKAAIKPEDDGLTPDDLKGPPRTQRRIKQLLERSKAATQEVATIRQEFDAAKPHVEVGKAIDSIIQRFGLTDDVKQVDDTDVAGAIQFQATIKRLGTKNGTDRDREVAASYRRQLDATFDRLGIAPTSAPKAPDLAELETAIAKAENDFEFDAVKAAIAKLKAVPAAPAAAPTPAVVQPPAPINPLPAAQVRQQESAPAPEPQANAQAVLEDRMYQQRATARLARDGVKDAPAYFQAQLMPQIVAAITKQAPGQNPIDVFHRLSPQARHDLTIEAHETVRSRAKAITPTATKTAQPRPVSSESQLPAWAKTNARATSASAAIAFLSGE